MKKTIKIILTLLLFLSNMTPVFTQSDAERKGTKIMKDVDERPIFQKIRADLTLEIFSSTKKKLYKKKFRLAFYTENFTNPGKRIEKVIQYFYAPPDDKGNALLSINYQDKDDDRWLYLKGLRKPKRIAGSDRGSDFMGSDFSQEDMRKPEFPDYKYTFLKMDKASFKGRKFTCYVIECVPKNDKIKNDLGYGKIIRWVEPKTLMGLKGIYYDTNMNRKKEGRLLEFIKGKNAAGVIVYFIKKMKMKDLQRGTSSVITFQKVLTEAKAKIRTDIFKLRYLTQRWW